jgi:hypothetical protein
MLSPARRTEAEKRGRVGRAVRALPRQGDRYRLVLRDVRRKHEGHCLGQREVTFLATLGRAVAFVHPSRLKRLNIHPSMRMRIDHGLANQPEPYVG